MVSVLRVNRCKNRKSGMMKKTKIVCSIGPASCSVDTMTQMVNVGMNVARINFSHATLEEKQDVVETVKKVREITKKHIAILYDTKGPEFRNGMMEDDGVKLVEGNTIRIVKEEVLGNSERFSVNHPKALDSLNKGSIVLLENGLMKIEVISKESDGVTCRIINGGILGNKKSLNAPGVHLDIPFISADDLEDIKYACHHDGNFLALSFVSTKEDVEEVRQILKKENNNSMKIISKIESTTGIKNLNDIIEVSDGIMVARGDLGVEVPMEQLPIYQKMIIKKCREMGKICIVATEMLESMKKNVRPTRAEVSDVANAVLDGTDAVMLSGETTTGKFPVETVRYMADICENTEKYLDYDHVVQPKIKADITDTIAHSVIVASKMLNTKLIVAATLSGYTAIKISTLKPRNIILAACPTEEIAYSLALNFGIYTTILPICDSTDEVVSKSVAKAKEFMHLDTNDLILVTGGFPNDIDQKSTNFLKIEKI